LIGFSNLKIMSEQDFIKANKIAQSFKSIEEEDELQ
jgi:hypothetical protein